MTARDRPRPAKDRVRLNHEAFAICRARGMSLADAAQAAGSRGTTRDGLTASGKAMEARPEVLAMIAAERARIVQAVQDDLDAAWIATAGWMRKVATGEIHATNMDRISVAQILGRALGRFQRPAPKDSGEPLPFASLLGSAVVVVDHAPPAAPAALPAKGSALPDGGGA